MYHDQGLPVLKYKGFGADGEYYFGSSVYSHLSRSSLDLQGKRICYIIEGEAKIKTEAQEIYFINQET